MLMDEDIASSTSGSTDMEKRMEKSHFLWSSAQSAEVDAMRPDCSSRVVWVA